jgi:hypothetical protein
MEKQSFSRVIEKLKRWRRNEATPNQSGRSLSMRSSRQILNPLSTLLRAFARIN